MEYIVEHLRKCYDKVCLIDDFNYSFQEGCITCILGESGIGKTTLLRILMGLELFDVGNIVGFDLAKKSAVFQEDRLCENLNAMANVRLVCDKSIKKEDIVRNLREVGLGDAIEKPVAFLSGGMKRRVAIVRALMAEYDVLYLDEPFKGFDEETREIVINYVKKKTIGKTVIMVTHRVDEVEKMDGVKLLLEKRS